MDMHNSYEDMDGDMRDNSCEDVSEDMSEDGSEDGSMYGRILAEKKELYMRQCKGGYKHNMIINMHFPDGSNPDGKLYMFLLKDVLKRATFMAAITKLTEYIRNGVRDGVRSESTLNDIMRDIVLDNDLASVVELLARGIGFIDGYFTEKSDMMYWHGEGLMIIDRTDVLREYMFVISERVEPKFKYQPIVSVPFREKWGRFVLYINCDYGITTWNIKTTPIYTAFTEFLCYLGALIEGYIKDYSVDPKLSDREVLVITEKVESLFKDADFAAWLIVRAVNRVLRTMHGHFVMVHTDDVLTVVNIVWPEKSQDIILSSI